MTHHSQIIDLSKKRAKSKPRKNYKHGLRCQTPAMLPAVEKTQFDDLEKQLTEKYQPNCPLTRHWIQVVAMGILKQRRIWQAEAAQAAEMMPVPKKPTPPEDPYGMYSEVDDPSMGPKTHQHPEVLRAEKRVLVEVVEVIGLFPEKLSGSWLEWETRTNRAIPWAQRNYPMAAVLHHEEVRGDGQDVSTHSWEQLNIFMSFDGEPQAETFEDFEEMRSELRDVAKHLKERIEAIDAIVQHRADLQQQHKDDLQEWERMMEERELAIASPIGPKIETLIKYQMMNESSMNTAIAQLENHLWEMETAKEAPKQPIDVQAVKSDG